MHNQYIKKKNTSSISNFLQFKSDKKDIENSVSIKSDVNNNWTTTKM